ncbi:hypothetical protein Bca4012_096457 [Brassica carinata]
MKLRAIQQHDLGQETEDSEEPSWNIEVLCYEISFIGYILHFICDHSYTFQNNNITNYDSVDF